MKRSRLNPYSKAQIPKLKRKLDIIFSALIRERDAKQPCIDLCEKTGIQQAGHFRIRERMSTRWNPKNVNGQNARCNAWDNDGFRHAKGIDLRWGAGTAEELERISRQIKQWDARELTALIAAAKLGYSYYVDVYQKIGPK